jgi:hypothetical protein
MKEIWLFSTTKHAIIASYLGAALDSTGFNDAGGACRGAAGLFKKPQKNSRKRRKLRTSSLIPCIGPSTQALVTS